MRHNDKKKKNQDRPLLKKKKRGPAKEKKCPDLADEFLLSVIFFPKIIELLLVGLLLLLQFLLHLVQLVLK